MWGIPAFLFLIAFLHRVAPGVVAKDIMQAFNASGAIVGLLSSMYFYAYAGFMIPAGLLIDALGVRRVAAAGSAVMGLGSLAMGLASSQPLLFSGRFLVGLGATVTFIGCLKIAANWFPPSHFGTMSAVSATVGVVGALVGTAPLAALVAATSWRGAFSIIGVATMLGIPYLRDIYALTTTEAATYASAISVALLFSAPLTGYLSDRVLRRRKLPYTVLSGCLFLIWSVFSLTLGALPLWGIAVLFFVMGLVGGAFVLTWPLGREVNPPHLAGTAVAVANMGGFVGAAVTQGPVGALLDHRWAGTMLEGARVYPLEAYRAAFLVCTLFVLAAAALSLLFRETRGRNIYHELYPGGVRGTQA